MRNMITCHSNNDNLVFRIIQPNFKRKDTYYLPLRIFEKALFYGKIIDHNIVNFLVLQKLNNIMYMSFYFNDYNYQNPMKYTGYKIIFNLNLEKFRDWIDGGYKGYYKQLDLVPKRSNRIIFSDSGKEQLRNILANQEIRKKFIKKICSFQGMGRGNIVFHKDFAPFSFFWYEEGGLHGGLIFHNNCNDYAIHT